MKNSSNYITFCIAVFLLLMTSCFEDKGNYDYVEIKNATIQIPGVSDLEDQISRSRFEALTLNPDIVFNAGATAGEFDYQWLLINKNSVRDEYDKYPEAKVIGTTQALSYNLVDDPGNYYVVLKVTNKETKSVSEYRFELDITSLRGWLVYDETSPDNGDFQIIKDMEIVPGLTSDQVGISRNYFSASNQGEKLVTSRFLSRRTHSSWDHLFLFSDKGMVKMDAGSYEVVTKNYADIFTNVPATLAPQAHYYACPQRSMTEVLVNNGVVYLNYYGGMQAFEQFTNPINTGMMSYFAEPIIASIPPVSSNTNTAVVYNSLGRGGFMTLSKYGRFAFPYSPEGLFNLAQINPDQTTDFRLQFMGEGQEGVTCAIFKDAKDNNRPWLYQADLRTDSWLAMAKIDLSGLKDINDAQFFTFGTRGDVMFYATSSVVRSYLFNNEVTDLLTLTNIKEKVVCMKLYTHSANENFNGRILFVATYDGNAGKVYKIKFNELNGKPEGNIEDYTGFGKIIDMMNKE